MTRASHLDHSATAVGNSALLASLSIELGALPSRADALRREGQGVMLIAVDGSAAGLIAVADPIKESAIGALKALRDERIRVVMLTGDSLATAAAVGSKLGIEEGPRRGAAGSKSRCGEKLAGRTQVRRHGRRRHQ